MSNKNCPVCGAPEGELHRTAACIEVERGKEKDWGDPIKWPFHYNHGHLECIDSLRAARPEHFKSFCVLTAMQYLWRAAYKDSELEDLRKAIWYIRMALGDDPRKD